MDDSESSAFWFLYFPAARRVKGSRQVSCFNLALSLFLSTKKAKNAASVLTPKGLDRHFCAEAKEQGDLLGAFAADPHSAAFFRRGNAIFPGKMPKTGLEPALP